MPEEFSCFSARLMKPTVLDCHKFTLPKQWDRAYFLLHTASISIFWILAVNDGCLAQQNPHNQQSSELQFGELLQVPKSPLGNKRRKSEPQTVPPPPGTSGQATGVAVAPKAKPSSQSVQNAPADDIKQLESGFVQQQMPGKVRKAPPNSVSPRPAVMAQQAQEQIRQISGLNVGQPNIQAAPLPPPLSTTLTQEFTAPSPPTFNQFLNSQPQQAPLPPLPGTPTPPFNQLINSQLTTQPSVPNTSTSTTTQLLNCQIVSSQPVPGSSAPTFNQVLNCQAATQSSVPNTSASITNQLLNCQAVPSPSAFGTATSPSNQLLNCQVVSSQPVAQTAPTAQSQDPTNPTNPTNPTTPPPPATTPPNTPQPLDRNRSPLRSTALSDQAESAIFTSQDRLSNLL